MKGESQARAHRNTQCRATTLFTPEALWVDVKMTGVKDSFTRGGINVNRARLCQGCGYFRLRKRSSSSLDPGDGAIGRNPSLTDQVAISKISRLKLLCLAWVRPIGRTPALFSQKVSQGTLLLISVRSMLVLVECVFAVPEHQLSAGPLLEPLDHLMASHPVVVVAREPALRMAGLEVFVDVILVVRRGRNPARIAVNVVKGMLEWLGEA
ncbi:hypothetical protein IWX49DRAFT_550311 [Phyllosticta citricarpa]